MNKARLKKNRLIIHWIGISHLDIQPKKLKIFESAYYRRMSKSKDLKIMLKKIYYKNEEND